MSGEEKPTLEDLTDEKQHINIGTLTAKFKLQPIANSCETTCITNILHELSDRFKHPDLHFSEAAINEACGYKAPRGYNTRKLIPGLRDILRPLGWTPSQESRVGHTKLRRVLINKDLSYPLVSLSEEYMREVLDHRTGNFDDHVVVLFRASGQWTVVYDPYGFGSPKTKEKFRTYGAGIIPIRTTDFIRYWTHTTLATKWMFWITKWSPPKRPAPLESYSEVQKAENTVVAA
ncbi:MAG: hypothetical protein JRN03_05305 [Nitrososphaerota archaeon]|nr:hypothetical protein [Nitrososphaerota archaeon]